MRTRRIARHEENHGGDLRRTARFFTSSAVACIGRASFSSRLRKRGRGAVRLGHVEKVPASCGRIDRSSREWPPSRRAASRNSKQQTRRVGKRPARMSVGLLTNERKETRRDDGRREPHKRREKSSSRVMKSRTSFARHLGRASLPVFLF